MRYLSFLMVSVLALASSAYALDIRQMNYAFRFDGARVAEGAKTFVINDGIPPVPPLVGAKKNPPIAVRMTQEPTAPTKTLADMPAPNPTVAPEIVSHKHTVHFQIGRAQLVEAEQKRLSAFVEALPDGADAQVIVHGYTCDRGPVALNTHLARKRARSVASFLMARGVIPTDVTGSGKCCYVTNDRALRHRNRRVEITVTGEDT